jgi:hypothetical protein
MTIRVKEPRYASARLSKKTKACDDFAEARTSSNLVSKEAQNPEANTGSMKFLKGENRSELGSQENECSSPNLGFTNQIKQELLSMIKKEKMGLFQKQKAAKEIEARLQ